ncbi:hypothetical protein EWM64_g8259 [Hericium alpestre]|uniref:Fe2OG dioxygenase domain-containing protein n=1 Tax=Hericium alpestre TaxID=135208 RepID=A0A4Y9ZP23_9AGAM|nr:hypothetical protein EWM64_g8259 [Hericium alpestre]
MSQTVSSDVLQPLTDAIVDKPPYVSGTLSLPLDCFNLFYKTGNGANYLNFTTATEAELAELAAACEAATFGRNKEDVLDESYRRAGKMDVDQFSNPIVPERTPLMQAIRNELLEGDHSARPIRLELYKLNVYSEGSFFKPHVDTPRSGAMFGSLVLVFPTQHEGGGLILRHGGKEWTVDLAKEFSQLPACSIGFIAFYSDVEHEVSLVRSGHRVTLTYNLYFEDITVEDEDANVDAELISTIVPNEPTFSETLKEMLSDPTFLPNGGLLGFGLRHKYPVRWSLDDVHKLLKGSDAVVWRAVEKLSLEPALYFCYEDWYPYPETVLFFNIPGIIEEETNIDEQSIISRIKEVGPTIVIERDSPSSSPSSESGQQKEPVVPVSWVTPLTQFTAFRGTYIEYGNQAEHQIFYAEVCLIARVPSFEERQRIRKDGELTKGEEEEEEAQEEEEGVEDGGHGGEDE